MVESENDADCPETRLLGEVETRDPSDTFDKTTATLGAHKIFEATENTAVNGKRDRTPIAELSI